METEIVNITKIKDGFFLGDEATAVNLDVIIQFKITHMINSAGPQIQNAWESIGIKYLTLNWEETPTQNLFDPKDEIANRIVGFIDDSARNGEGFLVHSVKGQNRACLVVLVYLIRKFRWSLKKSIEFLSSKKSDINIPNSFLSQINTYEARLCKIGQGPKSNTWNEVSTGTLNDIDNEEVLIRNTYLNSLVTTSVEDLISMKNSTLPKKMIGKRILWGDQSEKRSLIVNVVKKDLLLLTPKEIKPILTHKKLKPTKSCLKQTNSNINNNKISNNLVNLSDGASNNFNNSNIEVGGEIKNNYINDLKQNSNILNLDTNNKSSSMKYNSSLLTGTSIGTNVSSSNSMVNSINALNNNMSNNNEKSSSVVNNSIGQISQSQINNQIQNNNLNRNNNFVGVEREGREGRQVNSKSTGNNYGGNTSNKYGINYSNNNNSHNTNYKNTNIGSTYGNQPQNHGFLRENSIKKKEFNNANNSLKNNYNSFGNINNINQLTSDINSNLNENENNHSTNTKLNNKNNNTKDKNYNMPQQINSFLNNKNNNSINTSHLSNVNSESTNTGKYGGNYGLNNNNLNTSFNSHLNNNNSSNYDNNLNSTNNSNNRSTKIGNNQSNNTNTSNNYGLYRPNSVESKFREQILNQNNTNHHSSNNNNTNKIIISPAVQNIVNNNINNIYIQQSEDIRKIVSQGGSRENNTINSKLNEKTGSGINSNNNNNNVNNFNTTFGKNNHLKNTGNNNRSNLINNKNSFNQNSNILNQKNTNNDHTNNRIIKSSENQRILTNNYFNNNNNLLNNNKNTTNINDNNKNTNLKTAYFNINDFKNNSIKMDINNNSGVYGGSNNSTLKKQQHSNNNTKKTVRFLNFH